MIHIEYIERKVIKMPRAEVVTRLIKVTNVKVLAVSTSTQTTQEVEYCLPIVNSNKEKLLSYIKKNYDTSELKHVDVMVAKPQISRYTMSVRDFMKHAKIEIK